jgi:hypothetical protein
MARIIKPPNPLILNSNQPIIFLADSIDMGVAEQWQEAVEAAIDDLDVVILNPRRDAWDSSWPQTLDNKEFREQVEWELDGQERADLIAFYFAPNTKSPVTMLELGLFAREGKAIVCCPQGFWRKGNVDMTCIRYGLKQVETLEKLISEIRSAIVTRHL